MSPNHERGVPVSGTPRSSVRPELLANYPYGVAVRRYLLPVVLAAAVTGCSSTEPLAGSTNMAVQTRVEAADGELSWTTGRFGLLNPDTGAKACLTLVTEKEEYALTSADEGLIPSVWQVDGSLVEAQSGIAVIAAEGQDTRIVVPFTAPEVSVRGVDTDEPNPVCPDLPALAFVDATTGVKKPGDEAGLSSKHVWHKGRVKVITKDTTKCLVLTTKEGSYELAFEQGAGLLAVNDERRAGIAKIVKDGKPGKLVVPAGKPAEVYGGKANDAKPNCGVDVLAGIKLR